MEAGQCRHGRAVHAGQRQRARTIDRNGVTLFDKSTSDFVLRVVCDVKPCAMCFIAYPYSIPLVTACVDVRSKSVPAPEHLTVN